MSYEPGSMVFAVLSANDDEINLLGFGTYVGDELRPGTPEVFPDADYDMAEDAIKDTDENHPVDPEMYTDWLIEEGRLDPSERQDEIDRIAQRRAEDQARPVRERAHELLLRMYENPKIELDDGRVVWGYQCWWGPIEQWEGFIKDRKINHVTLP